LRRHFPSAGWLLIASLLSRGAPSLLIFIVDVLGVAAPSLHKNFIFVFFVNSWRCKHLALGVTTSAISSPVDRVHFVRGPLPFFIKKIILFVSISVPDFILYKLVTTVLIRIYILH
jgi:hypothetical protein